MQFSQKVLSALLAISLVGMACESSQQDAAPVEAAPVEETPVEEARDEAPRIVEAGVPADELIGVLPEGVGVSVGEKVESFTLSDDKGEDVSLTELLDEEKKVMLVFYRGGWCPFCNFQIHELTQAYEQFEQRGILPVAISVDKPEESAHTAAAYEIPFPVLSDPDLVAHRAFNVLNEMEAEEVERLGEMDMDIHAQSGRDHNTVAIPGIFILDGESVVRWAHANEDYRTRPSTEQLLRAIDGLE